jgi:hypothetical protein
MMLAQFTGFGIEMTLAEAESVSHSGRCDEDVIVLVASPKIRRQLDKIGWLPIRNELADYGAWDAHELQNDHANRQRIVWIAGCNITEEVEA